MIGNFAETMDQDQRLLILAALAEGHGYSLNEGIISTALASKGHQISAAKVRTELVWLEEQGLITVDQNSGLYVATLTQRGGDVVAGSSRVPGVRRPRPGEFA